MTNLLQWALQWAHDKMNTLGVPSFIQAVIIATVLIATAASVGRYVAFTIQTLL